MRIKLWNLTNRRGENPAINEANFHTTCAMDAENRVGGGHDWGASSGICFALISNCERMDRVRYNNVTVNRAFSPAPNSFYGPAVGIDCHLPCQRSGQFK
jgi:hypothetical protein